MTKSSFFAQDLPSFDAENSASWEPRHSWANQVGGSAWLSGWEKGKNVRDLIVLGGVR